MTIFVGSDNENAARRANLESKEQKSLEDRCRDIDNRSFVAFNVVFAAFIASFALFCRL